MGSLLRRSPKFINDEYSCIQLTSVPNQSSCTVLCLTISIVLSCTSLMLNETRSTRWSCLLCTVRTYIVIQPCSGWAMFLLVQSSNMHWPGSETTQKSYPTEVINMSLHGQMYLWQRPYFDSECQVLRVFFRLWHWFIVTVWHIMSPLVKWFSNMFLSRTPLP